jgi:hypothetical protein
MSLGIFLILCIISTGCLSPLVFADTLTTADFKSESWSKTIDYFNYLRLHETFTGKPTIPADWHAWTYAAYLDTTGFQLLYFGLQNVTFGNLGTLTYPVQTFLMHYKTENTSTDVVTGSSFLMLMAFNESTNTLFQGSPDVNDILYSSVSLGFDLNSTFQGQPPKFATQATVIPLTNSSDGLQWSWGMQYSNLTAVWYRTYISPNSPDFVNIPVAVTRYDELQFSYNLTLNKETHKATLTENHVIGRMRDLWIPWDWSYYNSTAHYGLLGGLKKDNTTIYDFLKEQKIEMSIIQYSTTMMINHMTHSESGAQNVTDSDVNVSNADVLTTSDTGEKIFDASFGTKKTYRLYNYTADSTENTYANYTAVTRTSKIRGFAFNGVISLCVNFVRLIPYALKDMDDTTYNYYRNHVTLLNVTGANYFYIISYPTYSGFRIVHDPMYTMYYAPSAATPTPENWLPVTAGAVIVIALIVVAVSLMMRRRKPQIRAQAGP